MRSQAVVLQSISKNSGKWMEINDFSLAVSQGEIHALVGPVQAGKTTILNMLVGAVRPTSGTGKIYHKKMGSVAAREYTGYVPAAPQFYPAMTVFEYLVYMGMLSGVTQFEAIPRAISILKRVELGAFRDKKPPDLPMGMRTKISIAQALMSRPKLLLMDEPVKGLDATGRMSILQLIQEISSYDKITVLLTAETWTETEMIADNITFIQQGKVFLSGKTNEVRKLYEHCLFVVSSSDNDKLMKVLHEVEYIKKISKTIDGNIILITDQLERFQKDLPGLVHRLDMALCRFGQEDLSCENISRFLLSDQGV